MIKINLLYRSVAEKEKKTNLARQLAIVAGATLLVIILIGAVQFSMMHMISKVETDIKTREARLLVLKKLLGEIEDIRTEKKILEKKLSVINRLEEDRLYPVRLLDEINNMVLPREIQLTKVSEQGQQLNIEGVGRDNIAVALFMKNLERSPYIASVNLLFSKQATVSNAKVYQFSLSCVKKRS
jgi:type IV pilus assembly protein PilN